MIFVHLDCSDAEHENVLEFFGITKEQCPTYVIFEMETSAKYLQTDDKFQDLSVSAMGGFVNDYFDGTLAKTVKSAELPEDWNTTPVKTLVATNFNDVVMDKTKDVFVEFYAPWCGKLQEVLCFKVINCGCTGHCKALAPTWDALGEKYKDSNKKI